MKCLTDRIPFGLFPAADGVGDMLDMIAGVVAVLPGIYLFIFYDAPENISKLSASKMVNCEGSISPLIVVLDDCFWEYCLRGRSKATCRSRTST
jgi:hypothetical protein